MPRRIHALEHDGPADLDDIAFAQSAVDTADALGCARMGKDLGFSRADESFIPARVVRVLVRVEDLGDGPPLLPGRIEAQAPFEGIYRESLPRLGTGDEVMEIPIGVRRPDSLNQHNGPL